MESSGSNRPLVLVADDEDLVRKLTRRLVERFGYPTLGAKDGAETLEVFRANAGDIGCILLDESMPALAGHQVVDILRREKYGVPIVLMTGYGIEDVRERLVGRAGVLILTKPFRQGQLTGILERAMRGGGTQGANPPG